MEYTNVQILTEVVNYWIKPLTSTFISSKIQTNGFINTANNFIKKWLPVSPNYSLSDELAWLTTPISDNLIKPYISRYVSKLDEESIPKFAHDFVDSMIEKSSKDGYVMFFENICIETKDIEELKRLLTLNLPIKEIDTYKIKL